MDRWEALARYHVYPTDAVGVQGERALRVVDVPGLLAHRGVGRVVPRVVVPEQRAGFVGGLHQRGDVLLEIRGVSTLEHGWRIPQPPSWEHGHGEHDLLQGPVAVVPQDALGVVLRRGHGLARIVLHERCGCFESGLRYHVVLHRRVRPVIPPYLLRVQQGRPGRAVLHGLSVEQLDLLLDGG